MSTLQKRLDAERLFESGRSLFEREQYAQSLAELARAEDAFRRIDVTGHPFSQALRNGVSGLANALALKARCYELLGDCANAIIAYETCLINARFERRRRFKRFWETVRRQMTSCYEERVRVHEKERITVLLNEPPSSINPAFAFPHSLDPDRASLARLYELAPEQYRHFREFYIRVRKQDRWARRAVRDTGFASLRNVGIAVWGALSLLWIAYGVITLRLLLLKK